MNKKFLIIIGAVAVALSIIIPVSVFLAKDYSIDVWDGTAGKLGEISNNQLVINNAEEFAGFAKSVNEGKDYAGITIKLAKDINLKEKTWTPIGLGSRSDLDSAKMFSGIFDGQGHTIKGLSNNGYNPEFKDVEDTYVVQDNSPVYTYNFGLFGMVKNATIKNVNVIANINCDDEKLKGDSVGALVGFSAGALTMDNCSVSGQINGGFDAVGGLVGRAYKSVSENRILITNCTNSANVKGAFKVAGILGYMSSTTLYATIDNCVNNGNITVTGAGYTRSANNASSFVAGIALFGFNGDSNTLIITNNKNTGNIISTPTATTNANHSLAFIATNCYKDFKDGYNYNFKNNENVVDAEKQTGLAYDLGEVVTGILNVSLNQSYYPSRLGVEANNLKNID